MKPKLNIGSVSTSNEIGKYIYYLGNALPYAENKMLY